jgi:hypothetical protein
MRSLPTHVRRLRIARLRSAAGASAGNTSGRAAAFLRANPDPYFVATAIMMIADSGRDQRLEQGLANIVAEHGERSV